MTAGRLGQRRGPGVLRVLLSAERPAAPRSPWEWPVTYAVELATAGLAVLAFRFCWDALGPSGLAPPAAVAVAAVLAVAQAAPFVLRRPWPLAAWAVLAAAILACWATERALALEPGRLSGVGSFAGLFVLYRVGLTQRTPAALAVAVLSVGGTATGTVLLRLEPLDSWWPVLMIGTPVLLGRVVAARRQAEADLAEQREAHAVLAERARIARELHDVVAHHMSVVAVQAESAPSRLGAGLPAPVSAEFGSIAESARGCLDELRGLLGALRQGAGPAPTAPQPTLGELDELATAVRRTGAQLWLEVDGPVRELPPACSVNAYRIVQEAWSNAVRHAPGAAVTTTITVGDGTVRIDVRNGAGTGRPGCDGGHGLRSMRERARSVGGSLSAEPAGDGGFRVRATLPVDGAGS